MSEHHERSRLPEGSREHTFLVYDKESGEVVHGHKSIVLPDGDAPSDEELERQALEAAAEVTNRDASSLKALPVAHDDLEHGAHYRVDTASSKLERVSPKQ
jgi:hypothetical protein